MFDSGAYDTHMNIQNVVATNGSINFVGRFDNLTVKVGATRTIEEEIRECRASLFLTDPDLDRETLITTRGERVEGTCEWIRHNRTYMSWLQGEISDLWISGGPGHGKTYLSIFISQELEYLHKRNGDHVLFYFCANHDDKRHTSVAILRGLIWQLLKSVDLAAHSEEWLSYFERESRTNSTLADPEALWKVLICLLHSPNLRRVFCVIDGLDECDEESRWFITSKLRNLSKEPSRKDTPLRLFNLVIVSRELSGLEAFPQVKLDPDHDNEIKGDIDKFIFASLNRLTHISGFENNFQSHLSKMLKERAEGTFLWVGPVISELSKKATITEIYESLDSIPEGLHRIFDRMLTQIAINKRGVCAEILRQMTHSLGPLSLEALAEVVKIQPRPGISVERAILDAINFCGPFLRVNNGVVTLVHQSVKEYLLTQNKVEEFRIQFEEDNLKMAKTCLQTFEKSALCTSKFPSWEKEVQGPLLRYAIIHWVGHASSFCQYAKDFD